MKVDRKDIDLIFTESMSSSSLTSQTHFHTLAELGLACETSLVLTNHVEWASLLYYLVLQPPLLFFLVYYDVAVETITLRKYIP